MLLPHQSYVVSLLIHAIILHIYATVVQYQGGQCAMNIGPDKTRLQLAFSTNLQIVPLENHSGI